MLPAKNGEEQTMQFLLEVVDILLNYVRKTFDRSTKVLDFHHPHQLLEGMEGFNLELSDNPESLEQILVDCRDTLKYGVRTGRFSHGSGEPLGEESGPRGLGSSRAPPGPGGRARCCLQSPETSF